MKRLSLALIVVGMVVWGCGELNMNAETVDEGDVEFVAQSTWNETNAVASSLENPGSPILDRYSTGGFFVWNYQDNGNAFPHFLPDTLQDSVVLTCVSHSVSDPTDGDGDKVFQNDVITFDCPGQHFTVMRGGELFDIYINLRGQIAHDDQDDNDRAVFHVSWHGIDTTNFHQEILIVRSSSGDTLINRNVDTHGDIRAYRDSLGIALRVSRHVESDGRVFTLNLMGHLFTQNWEPGDSITSDMDAELSGNATAITASGREVSIDMYTDNTVTIGVCDGQEKVGVKGGSIVQELSVSGVHVRTITIQFNSDCTYNVIQ